MCRDFLPRALDQSQVERLVASAFRGPSAGNSPGLDLIVLESEEKDRYWDLTLPPDKRETFRWPGLLQAPLLIVPVVSPGAYLDRYSMPDKISSGLGEDDEAWSVPYWFVDGGAAVMAMLLCAEAMGLGALFFGHFDHERSLLEAFGVPAGHRTLGTIAIGHAAPGGREPSLSARTGRPLWSNHTHTGRWSRTSKSR